MALLEGDGRYGDVLEQALYNNSLSGLSLDGERFFYDNPLASRGGHHRWTWHRCPCCPPNIARLIASLGSYVYSTAPGELTAHLYVQSDAHLQVDGAKVAIRQTSNYPWEGAIAFAIDPETAAEFTLRLRIPGWCRSAELSVNGQRIDVAAVAERGYAAIRRRWQRGDKVTLGLAMPVERIYAHPDVQADQGRVALKRGPMVYCVEAVDTAAPPHLLKLPRESAIVANLEPDLLGGVATLSGTALAIRPADESLYRTQPWPAEGVPFKAVPYPVWDHREPGEMVVWLPET